MCESNYPDLSQDLLTIRGIGVFTVFMARHGRVFRFDDHWDRIVRSCRDTRIVTDRLPSVADALRAVHHALSEADHARSMVRMIVTAGDTKDGKHAVGDPKLLILVDPMPSVNHGPLRLAFQSGGRKRPEIKMVGPYADLMLDLAKAQEDHCQDVLYFCEDPAIGIPYITETTCGNIFFVTKDNRLITPIRQVLAGVTRRIILDLMRESDIFVCVEERSMRPEPTLSCCVEAFRTASISGIVPIRSIGDYQFKIGPGTRTEKVQKLYVDYVDGYFS